MNPILKLLTLSITLSIAPLSKGQVTKLSLKEAVDFAMQNHPDIKNKILGEKYADAQVMETRSIGIPQINGNVQLINNTQKQVFVFPVNGTPTPIRVGNSFVTTATVQASWLALDAGYFLGLKAAEAFTDLAKLQTNINERDVAVNVTKAYYLVLITKENISLLEQNIKTLESVLFQTEGYFQKWVCRKNRR